MLRYYLWISSQDTCKLCILSCDICHLSKIFLSCQSHCHCQLLHDTCQPRITLVSCHKTLVNRGIVTWYLLLARDNCQLSKALRTVTWQLIVANHRTTRLINRHKTLVNHTNFHVIYVTCQSHLTVSKSTISCYKTLFSYHKTHVNRWNCHAILYLSVVKFIDNCYKTLVNYRMAFVNRQKTIVNRGNCHMISVSCQSHCQLLHNTCQSSQDTCRSLKLSHNIFSFVNDISQLSNSLLIVTWYLSTIAWYFSIVTRHS